MRKSIYVVPLVVLAVLAFERSRSPKVEVADSVKPYLEEFLTLTIDKKHKVIYETYLHEHVLTLEEFSARMNYFATIFGSEPKSFSHPRSYIGGVGYFIQYNLTLADGQTHSCAFGFPAKEGSLLVAEDLERLSVSADFGEKSFIVDFKNGDVSACKAPDGCYGENTTD